jgi:hypothetical protein
VALQAATTTRRLESVWENLPNGGTLLANQLQTLQVRHRAVGGALEGVMVLFCDGDPAQEGSLFDTELIPHIDAHGSFVSRVPCFTGGCGAHQLFVRAIPTDGSAPVARFAR